MELRQNTLVKGLCTAYIYIIPRILEKIKFWMTENFSKKEY